MGVVRPKPFEGQFKNVNEFCDRATNRHRDRKGYGTIAQG